MGGEEGGKKGESASSLRYHFTGSALCEGEEGEGEKG